MTDKSKETKHETPLTCEKCGKTLRLLNKKEDGWLGVCSDEQCGALYEGLTLTGQAKHERRQSQAKHMQGGGTNMEGATFPVPESLHRFLSQYEKMSDLMDVPFPNEQCPDVKLFASACFGANPIFLPVWGRDLDEAKARMTFWLSSMRCDDICIQCLRDRLAQYKTLGKAVCKTEFMKGLVRGQSKADAHPKKCGRGIPEEHRMYVDGVAE